MHGSEEMEPGKERIAELESCAATDFCAESVLRPLLAYFLLLTFGSVVGLVGRAKHSL